MAYDIELSTAAAKTLRKMDPQIRRRLVPAIEALADDPRPDGVKKLKGREALWRVRVGDFRIIYEIEDAKLIIYVLHVANRKDAY
ncbi:type II toxin-antitoxin system RelE/ParE family toxin [Lujinxingia sediminis]|uniref:Type II toxin-antitoxin system RelE/ParE family toxin n=1 Tax=Lujinxingia sediminis TaxID=2480984 RepID=A0ABY0CMT5_9DELT|nr:type II toxin-antitoxin system RelE/ParE family toxin [Lujinxingia sediminis]RVU40976.1 type II toxin-antitoxin system RelE/ParE family toxin [Lujinxingia sediminis]